MMLFSAPLSSKAYANTTTFLSGQDKSFYSEMDTLDKEFSEEIPLDKIVSINKVDHSFYSPTSSTNYTGSEYGPLGYSGEIRPQKMSLNIAVSHISESRYKIYTLTTWKTTTLHTMTDLLAIAWGGGHTLISDSMKVEFTNGYVRYPVGTLKDVSPNIGVSRAFSTSRYIPGERISYDAKKITYVAIIEAHGRGTSNVVAGYAHKIFDVTGIGASFSDGKVSFGAGLEVLMDIFTNYTHFYH